MKKSKLEQSTAVKMEDRGQTEFSLEHSYEKLDAFIETVNANLGGFPDFLHIPDFPANPIMMNSLSPSLNLDYLTSNSPYHRRFNDSTTSFPRNEFYSLPGTEDFKYDEFTQSSFGYHSLPGTPSLNSMCFSNSHPNDTLSASKPTIEAVKPELSSLQYLETDLGRRDIFSPPLDESVVYDTPMTTSLQKSDQSCNSGLLGDVVNHAYIVDSSKNLCFDKSSNLPIASPGEDYNSTFGTTSHECLAVNANGNSFDAQQPAQTLNGKYLRFV